MLAKPNSTPVLMFHIILFQCDFLHKHKQPAISVNPHRVEIILSTYTTCIIYIQILQYDFSICCRTLRGPRSPFWAPQAALPSHLLGRWTQSSSPSFAAPTEEIRRKNDKYATKIIPSALSESLSCHKTYLTFKQLRRAPLFPPVFTPSSVPSLLLLHLRPITSAKGVTQPDLRTNQRRSSGRSWTNERQRRVEELLEDKRYHSALLLRKTANFGIIQCFLQSLDLYFK